MLRLLENVIWVLTRDTPEIAPSGKHIWVLKRDSSFVPLDFVLFESNACHTHGDFAMLRMTEEREESLYVSLMKL